MHVKFKERNTLDIPYKKEMPGYPILTAHKQVVIELLVKFINKMIFPKSRSHGKNYKRTENNST